MLIMGHPKKITPSEKRNSQISFMRDYYNKSKERNKVEKRQALYPG
jgi:hypothetical protein